MKNKENVNKLKKKEYWSKNKIKKTTTNVMVLIAIELKIRWFDSYRVPHKLVLCHTRLS